MTGQIRALKLDTRGLLALHLHPTTELDHDTVKRAAVVSPQFDVLLPVPDRLLFRSLRVSYHVATRACVGVSGRMGVGQWEWVWVSAGGRAGMGAPRRMLITNIVVNRQGPNITPPPPCNSLPNIVTQRLL